MKESIPSPFLSTRIPKDMLERWAKELGVASLFVAISKEPHTDECEKGNCQGHSIEACAIGFGEGQLLALFNRMGQIAEDAIEDINNNEN